MKITVQEKQYVLKRRKIVADARQIANTILQQLGGNKFITMTGAKNLVFDSDGSLSFKIGKNPKGINHVKIILTPSDTYGMAFYKVKKFDFKIVKKQEGIYADDLQKVFTDVTGLDTYL